MKEQGIIIQASARDNGNTAKLCSHLQALTGYAMQHLCQKNISQFDYDFQNKKDDFRPLFKNLVSQYKTLVLATPIYWYSMSGHLKVFLDRISDFLFEEQEQGRRLREMNIALLCCGNDKNKIEGFENPIKLSAQYLGTQFLGHQWVWQIDGEISKQSELDLQTMAKNLLSQTKWNL